MAIEFVDEAAPKTLGFDFVDEPPAEPAAAAPAAPPAVAPAPIPELPPEPAPDFSADVHIPRPLVDGFMNESKAFARKHASADDSAAAFQSMLDSESAALRDEGDGKAAPYVQPDASTPQQLERLAAGKFGDLVVKHYLTRREAIVTDANKELDPYARLSVDGRGRVIARIGTPDDDQDNPESNLSDSERALIKNTTERVKAINGKLEEVGAMHRPSLDWLDKAGLITGMDPDATNFVRRMKDNAGATVGGAAGLSAAAALAPETGGVSLALALLGGYIGSQAGGQSQEELSRLAESPQETTDRHLRAALGAEESPGASKAADLASAAILFRPDPKTIKDAVSAVSYLKAGLRMPDEEASALRNTLGAFGIGAGQHVAISTLTGQPITLGDVFESGAEMAFFSKPTALGKSLGLPSHEEAAHQMEAAGMPRTAMAIEEMAKQTTGDAPEAPAGDKPAEPLPPPADPVKRLDEVNTRLAELADAHGRPQQTFDGEHLVDNPEADLALEETRLLEERKKLTGEVFPPPEEAKAPPAGAEAPAIAPPAVNGEGTKPISEAAPAPENQEGVATPPEPVKDGTGVAEETPAPSGGEASALLGEDPVEVGVDPAPPDPVPVPAGGSGDPTSIKNAQVDMERRRRGLPPAMEPARRSFGKVWDEAMAEVSRDPNRTNTLVRELDREPRPLTDLEDALLLHRQIELQNQFDSTARRLKEAQDSGNTSEADRLREQSGNLLDELQRLYDIDKAVGTANSRGLNARKMMAREDFSLVKMTLKKLAAAGGEYLSPEQRARAEVEVATLHARIRDLQTKFDEWQAGKEEAASHAAMDAEHQKLLEEADKDPVEEEPADEPAPAASEAAAAGEEAQTGLKGYPPVPVPTGEIASKPELMQFKRVDDPKTGVNEEDLLSGEFDERKAGLVLLWQPVDPAAYGLEPGQKYIVANGHHRVEFANRKGVEKLYSQVVREADGISAAEARTLGAEINITDGKGTIYDQAKFIRNYAATHGADEALAAARRIGAKGRKAAEIALSASDRLFDAFTNGAIHPDAAAAIAEAVPKNEAAQLAGMRAAMNGKDAAHAANRAKAELLRDPNAKREGPVEYDLFGNEVFAEVDAQAERASLEQKKLSQEIQAVRGAANRPEMAAKHGVDVKDPEGVKKRIAELEAERARWENWPNHPDLVAITREGKGASEGPAAAPSPSSEEAKPDKGAARAEKKKLLQRALDALSSQAEQARERLKQKAESAARGESLFSGPLDVSDIEDYAIIGADLIAKGAKTVGRFTAKMVLDFGEWIRPHVGRIYAAAREKHRLATSPRDLNAERESIVRGISERVQEGDELTDVRSYVRKLALNLVRRGVTDREELVDAVHRELEPIVPGLTRRAAMDLISGYGDFKQLDPEAAKKTLRDLKGQLQQIGKLQDMLAGEAPKKTGVERREVSREEAKFIKEVNEMKKTAGFEVTDPATQLRTALDAVKTRVKNQIRDLAEEIATGKKPRQKTGAPRDEETARLEAIRDQLKKTLADLEEKPGRTDEERVKAALEATGRSLAEYERRLKQDDFKTGGKETGPTSPELEAMRAKRNALRQEYTELRALHEDVIAQKQEARTRQIEEQIAELDRRFKEGDISSHGQQGALLTPAQESLVAERDAMRRHLEEIRREATRRPDAEKQVERLLKQIDAIDTRLKTGDLDPKTKNPVTPLSPEAERLMSLRDAMTRELIEQRAAAKPKRTQEEIALQAWKTRALSRIAELKDRTARGDFATPEKHPVKLDGEGTKLHFQLEDAKREFNEGLMNDRLRQRTFAGKLLGGAGQALNAARALMTSIDLSAVLRQGGFVSIAHPIRALRAFPAMFRAMASREGAHAVEMEIRQRPNAVDGLYKRARLALSEADTSSLTAMEEAYMSRFIEHMPRMIGGGLVRGSERAYRAFLNRMRADSFDAMVKSLGMSKDVTLEEAKAIARFVNCATGRPSLGDKMDKAAAAMNHFFFAPKYVASRFMLALNPFVGFSVTGGSARVRMAVAREYGQYLAGMGLVIALGKFAGATFETDPRATDAYKLKFGNTRLDMTSGIAQAVTFASRMITGKTVNSQGKEISLVHGDKDAPEAERIRYGGKDAYDLTARFLRTKFSPALGTAVDLRTKQDVVGQPVKPTTALAHLAIPLSFQDVKQAMEEQGVPRGTALALLAIFGASIQRYEDKKPKAPSGR